MTTLNRLILSATLAATALALTHPAAADRISIGGGIVFGGSGDHHNWQVGIGTGGLGLGVALGGWHGGRHERRHCEPVIVAPPVCRPRVVAVHRPVVVVPAPVIYAAVPAPTCRARVVEYISPYRRVSQPMIHGHPAVIEVRGGASDPWVVVAEHPSIW